jgi:molybdopterin-guanine dinucleotide biosynthesis protein A
MAATGAVVLAGGQSSRMGSPKADLEWHGSTLLRRVVGLAARGVDGTVVVVRAPGQDLPPLPASVEVVDDVEEGRGPLQGIATGLEALAPQHASAFVCSTDLPFLHPAVVRAVVRALGDGDVALPVVRGFRQPLVAAYRTSLAERARKLLAQDRDPRRLPARGRPRRRSSTRRPCCRTGGCGVGTRRSPPSTASTTRWSTRRRAAVPRPEVTVQRFGVLAGSGATTVRAATLGAAAQAVGLVLDRHLLAAVDGDAVVRDVETPLAHGDAVTFLSADAGG